MLSKNKIREIQKLHKVKYRKVMRRFFAEGPKIVLDLANDGFFPLEVYADEDWLEEYGNRFTKAECFLTTASDLKKISGLQTPNRVLAVYQTPEENDNLYYNEWVIALDDVQDPGNLGTIIRLADWFGISHILCSNNTVDVFNPKVVQSTMASIARVKVHYVDLEKELKEIVKSKPIYAAAMDGQSVYETDFEGPGILVMGNEGNGLSKPILNLISRHITIPKFNSSSGVESLNVAMATGIILSHIRG